MHKYTKNLCADRPGVEKNRERRMQRSLPLEMIRLFGDQTSGSSSDRIILFSFSAQEQQSRQQPPRRRRSRYRSPETGSCRRPSRSETARAIRERNLLKFRKIIERTIDFRNPFFKYDLFNLVSDLFLERVCALHQKNARLRLLPHNFLLIRYAKSHGKEPAFLPKAKMHT